MPEQPRSRRQTRAAILGHLLQSGGSFRPPLAKAVRLSEASLSRILFDLKAEGLIEEVRRPAPYVGGPSGLVSLDNSVRLAAIELTGQRLSVGVGGLSGELHYTERLPLPKKPTIESVGRAFRDALQLLGDWTRRRRVRLSQIGVAVPGLGRLSELDNPNWWQDGAVERLQEPLLHAAATYFLSARSRTGGALDPVARFHLGNGARLEQLNPLADLSEKALAQSHGLMVNYLYDVDDIEKNHEAYAENRTIVTVGGIRKRARTPKELVKA